MNKERLINNFIEMIKIHSPSKQEKEFANYMVNLLKKEFEAEIYLDNGFENYGGNAPTIFAKIKGNVKGEGITLAAHMDVIEPNSNVNPIIENGIIKTDGTTTLGGDDKGGVACIVEILRTLKETHASHEDIYVLLTPCEESGLQGAKNVNWTLVPNHMKPAKNMLVIDNAGKAGIIAHTAPSKYDFEITFKGKKAHAGIEPEKGINAVSLSATAISQMNIGRIDSLTTSNIGIISSDSPTNVVPDTCFVKGEIRSHSEDKILEIIKEYDLACKKATEKLGGTYNFNYICDFPTLKPKDDLKFAKEFADIYESIGVQTELKVIGGGSDSNIFAKEGYNSIIIGVGMNNVHTVDEFLEIEELFKTTEAVIKYISK